MDEISPLISLPFKLGNLVSDESVFAACVDISGIELISMTKLPLVLPLNNRNSSSSGVTITIGSICDKSTDDDDDNLLAVTRPNESCLMFTDATSINKGDDTTALVADIVNSRDENKNITVSHRIKKSESWDSFRSEIAGDVVSGVEEKCEIKEHKRTYSTSILEVSEEMKVSRPNFPLNFPPLWGSASICGRRAEMEDSFVALPRFLKIPSKMLSENPLFNSINQDLTSHLFGVYDGHGGSQVANYCRERLHLALAEEIGIAKEYLSNENGECNLKEQWLSIFTECFHRMDDEVGGFPRVDEDIASDTPLQPIAPDSVGSTAVIAIVCSTHIIVANCGDSRAVLYRGKVTVPMSVDHKPNREDECARIEGAGGKVINWDGYRVSGVLACRDPSVCDRYLRPYVVADPEIMFVPRTKEDECLILASDGLWDVMTNEEACDFARRRILIWHKKNGTTLFKERGKDIDLAAQDAADYLSQLAFQRGSRDNISVIVVDLKAQRKFKKKT